MGMRILVAEDEAVFRHLLRKLLRQWGYTVVEVDNGTAALNVLEEPGAPKLAILDWMMPGLNGPEVVRKLRQSKPTPYTYVLLLSAKSEKADILTGLDSEADDYLTKPFDTQELRARLRVGERIMALTGRNKSYALINSLAMLRSAHLPTILAVFSIKSRSVAALKVAMK